MAKWIVTGGAGFIGSHTVEALLQEGHFVYLIDNFSIPNARSNLAEIISNIGEGKCSQLEVIEHDLKDDIDLPQDAEYVLHLAAMNSIPRCEASPKDAYKNNAIATAKLVEACMGDLPDLKRFVYASSSSIYGNCDCQVTEGETPAPESIYGFTKYLGEVHSGMFQVTEQPCTILRYCNVYGPRQNAIGAFNPVIANWCRASVEGGMLVRHDMCQSISRHFTYVSDVVRANIHFATADLTKEYDVFNIGYNQPTTLAQILRTISAIRGEIPRTRYENANRRSNVTKMNCSTTKAEIAGFMAEVGIEQGIRELLAYEDRHHRARNRGGRA